MRVLVTGASGFLGGWVAQRLAERGHVVRAFVRAGSRRAHLEGLAGLELAEGRVEDPAAVLRAVDGVDAIVHAAGLVKARREADFVRTNVDGTRALVEAARCAGSQLRRFVLVSSLEAAGPSRDARPVPVHQERPVTAYGRSKLAAEKVLLEHRDGVRSTILRPGAVYGPRERELLAAFRAVKRGLLPLVDGGRALGSFIYGPDCADACVQALHVELPSGSVLHLTDGGPPVTQQEFLHLVEQAVGRRAFVRVSLPRVVLTAVAHGVKTFGALTGRAVMLTPEKAQMLLQDFPADGQPAIEALGWRPRVSLHQGLHLAARWYRERGWI